MGFLEKLWKYSSARFYILNFCWNISFWLFCKKMYKNISFNTKTDDFFTDDILKMNTIKKKVSKKRFVGYLYKNRIYLDNPGFDVKDDLVLKRWIEKGLIKI